MGCSHCLADAASDGAHMAWETFQQAVDFCREVRLPLILTGGEPTDHPLIIQFLAYAKNQGLPAAVLSNGLFLSCPSLRTRVLDLAQSIQVTNDPRFYPQWVPDYPHPKIFFERHIAMVAPFGRALVNRVECTRQSPNCFHLRSVVRCTHQLVYSLHLLGLQGKLCTPSINIDGTLVAGEAPSCYPIGSVRDSYQTITGNIINMRCNRCGLVTRLVPELRGVIGES